MTSLSPSALAAQFGATHIPQRTAVLHLGLGNFHRGHQAHFFDRLLKQGNQDWGIAAVNIRSREIVEAMQRQDNGYLRWQRGQTDEALTLIRSHKHSFHMPTDGAAVLRLFAEPSLQLVTVTVSEKGYHYDNRKQTLDTSHADVQAYLADPSRLNILPAIVAAGLEARRCAGGTPLTVMSCDNYRNNGAVLRSVVEAVAERGFPQLSAWMNQGVSFPATMVDGIVPKVRTQDRQEIQSRTGFDDQALVITEDYMRWVIADDFAGEKPPLETVGAEIVSTVAPYEDMKLMLLNGPHSALSYMGHNAGFEFIHQAMAEPSLKSYLARLLNDELLPIAKRLSDAAVSYGAKTLARFANTHIAYQNRQVATDGSLKIPERLLPPIRAHLKDGVLPEGLALALAAWIKFLSGQDEQGNRYTIPDANSATLSSRLAEAGTSSLAKVKAVFGLRGVFPDAIADHHGFAMLVATQLSGLQDHGTLNWLSKTSFAGGTRQ